MESRKKVYPVEALADLIAAFNILFVLGVLSHSRRKVVHFNVTSNPTAEWTAHQVVEAFP